MASERVQELNDTNFDDVTASGVVLIDFWAPGCGPCKSLTPIIDDVAEQIGDAAVVAKVNVDEATAVADRFDIRSIPTIIILKDGELEEHFVGIQQAETLMESLEIALEEI